MVEPSALLRTATQLKKQGKIDEAINTLREAYSRIAVSDTAYPIETYLRLPMYLLEAGRNDEGWKEFNMLILHGYPNRINKKEVIVMDLHAIYDKMRLFCDREKRYKDAVLYALEAYLCWASGLVLQKRKVEYDEYTYEKACEKTIKRLLIKLNQLGKEELIKQLAEKYYTEVPKVNYSELRDELMEIIK